jgi:hypothetical protein
MSSGSITSASSGSSSAASGRRITMPSSPHIVSTGRSKRSSSRRSIAIAHGACTGVPNGLRMHTRQSPISSRKRSTTTVRSSGTAPVASACSSRYCTRLAGRERVERVVIAQPGRARRRATGHGSRARTRRAPGPSSSGRPDGRRARTASCPAARCRGDGDPLERDVLDAPRGRAEQERLAGPALVDHLLVELAHPGAVGQEHAEQPRSGMVPPLVTASRFAPSRARTTSLTRSHTTRGRSSENSSLG